MQQQLLLTHDFLAMTQRPRRNRKSQAMRALIQETRLHPAHFVAPIFVVEGHKQKIPIASMPGIFRFSIDELLQELHLDKNSRIKRLGEIFYSTDIRSALGAGDQLGRLIGDVAQPETKILNIFADLDKLRLQSKDDIPELPEGQEKGG